MIMEYRLDRARTRRALSLLMLTGAGLFGCRPPQTSLPPEPPPEPRPRASTCKQGNPTEDVLAALALRSILVFGRVDAGVYECADGQECQKLKLDAALVKQTAPERREDIEGLLEVIQKDPKLSRAFAAGYRKSRAGCDVESCGDVRVEASLIRRDACNASFALKAVNDARFSPERFERFRTLYGGGGQATRIMTPAPVPSSVGSTEGAGAKGQASLLMQMEEGGTISVPTYWDPSCDAAPTDSQDSCYVAAYDATTGFCHEMSGALAAKKRAGECCQIWPINKVGSLLGMLTLAKCP